MLKLEIVTPEKKVIDTEADTVTVPTASGEVGLLANHAPMISALKPGILSYSARGVTEKLAVSGGFVEINNDRVSVLADAAETADEIDADTVRVQRENAARAIADAASLPLDETEALREGLEAAEARLKLAAGK